MSKWQKTPFKKVKWPIIDWKKKYELISESEFIFLLHRERETNFLQSNNQQTNGGAIIGNLLKRKTKKDDRREKQINLTSSTGKHKLKGK